MVSLHYYICGNIYNHGRKETQAIWILQWHNCLMSLIGSHDCKIASLLGISQNDNTALVIAFYGMT
jgi:hypothetical protein